MADLAVLTALLKLDSTQFQKGIEGAVSKLDDVAGTMKTIGKGMSVAITAPLAAIGGAALAAGLEFEKSMNTIRKQTGATGTALQGLTEDMKVVYASTTASSAEVAQAISILNTRFGETGQIVQEVALAELRLAKLTGEDLNTSLDTTTRLFGDWGVQTSDQVSKLDELWRTSQLTGISTNVLAERLVTLGGPLRALGFGLEESMAVLGKFEAEGVVTENVMSSLRIALSRMAATGVTDASEAFDALVEEVKAAPDYMTALGIATETFGTKAAVNMTSAIREGRFETQALWDSITNGSETLAKAAGDTATFASKLEMLRHNVAVALEPLGTLLVDMLNSEGIPALKAMGEAVRGLGARFAALPDPAKKGLVVVAGALAAIGPALLAISGTISAVSAGLTTLGGIAGAVAGAGGLMAIVAAAGPVVLALAGVAASIGYVAYSFRDKSEEMSEVVSAETKKIIDDYAAMGDGITATMRESLWSGTALTSDQLNQIKADAETMMNTVIAAINEKSASVRAGMIKLFAVSKALPEGEEQQILANIDTITEAQLESIIRINDELKALQNDIAANGGKVTQEQVDKQIELNNQLGEAMVMSTVNSEAELQALRAKGAALREGMTKEEIAAITTAAHERIKIVEEAAQKEKEAYADTLDQALAMGAITSGQYNTLLNDAESSYDGQVDAAKRAYGEILQQAAEIMPELKRIMDPETGGLFDVEGVINDEVIADWKNAGQQLWSALSDTSDVDFSSRWNQSLRELGVNGISSMAEAATSKMADAAPALEQSMSAVGSQTGQGFVQGLEAQAGAAYLAGFTIGQSAVAGTRAGVDAHSPSREMMKVGEDVVAGFVGGIYDKAPEVDEAAKALADKVKRAGDALKDAFEEITESIKDGLVEVMGRLDIQIARLDISRNLTDYQKASQKLDLELQKLNEEIAANAEQQATLTAAMDAQKQISGETSDEYKDLAKELNDVQRESQKLAIELEKVNIQIEEQRQKLDEDKTALIENAETLRNEIIEAEKKAFDERVDAANKYAENRMNVETQLAEDIETAYKEHNDAIADIIAQGAADEASALDEYQNALESKISELYSWTDLFDSVNQEQTNGSVLLANLEGQVNAFDNWSANIASLASKGIDEGLLAELRKMGPDAGAQIATLNQMTEEQLAQYTVLWKRKNEQVKAEAMAVMADQHKEMEAKLVQIRATTAEQLDLQNQELQTKLMEIRSTAVTELERYKTEWEESNRQIQTNTTKTIDDLSLKFETLAKKGTDFGINLLENFEKALVKGFPDLLGTVDSLVSQVNSSAGLGGGNLRAYASGGYVPSTGPALLHAGEYVLNASAFNSLTSFLRGIGQPAPAAALASAGGTTNYITINSNDENAILRALRRLGVK